jgi:DNA-binding HxlR family transcriptional regulator
MYRYGQFCPIAAACEIFAERWTPLVLRELLCGSRRFNELQRGVPLMSRTLLAQRLRELEDAGIVERLPKPNGHGFEYQLSRAGEELRPIILQLGEWGLRWVYTHVSTEDLDPSLLMWDLHRRIHTEALPERRVVVQFEFSGLPRGTRGMKNWWLVLERPEVELCLKDPGHEVDLLVNADLFAMTRVWAGELNLRDALRQRLITLRGPSWLAKAFPGWLKLGVFAQQTVRFTSFPP